jgi:hypothetical protein
LRPLRQRARDLLISGAATALVASALIWVLRRLWNGPPVTVNPVANMIWCGEFAFIATALSVAARVFLRKPVPALLVVATLAMWALLPPTLAAAYVLLIFTGPVGSLVVAVPLLLAVAARSLAARGLVVRAAAVLLAALLIVTAATLFLPRPPQPPAWLIVPGWHVLLGVATLAAAAWDRHVASATSAKFFYTG